MAGDAGVGAAVEVAQVALAGGDSALMAVVGSRVAANPGLGGSVTGFAGHAVAGIELIVVGAGGIGFGGQSGQGGVTSDAARGGRRVIFRRAT